MQSSIIDYLDTPVRESVSSETTPELSDTSTVSSSCNGTAEKRPRSLSDPINSPSGLRLSPVSKKIVYDGDTEVYKFDAPPPTWVTMLFSKIESLTDTVTDMKTALNDSVDKFLELQTHFEAHKKVTDERLDQLETYTQSTAEDLKHLETSVRQNYDRLTKELNEALEMIDNKVEEHVKISTLAQKSMKDYGGFQDDLEQYSRRNCLVLHGIPETKQESTDKLVVDTINSKLNVKISPTDLDRTHRIGKHSPVSNRPRAIIVKFARYNVRASVFREKKLLKNSKIMLTESLTSGRMRQLQLAKAKFGVRNVWTSDGEILRKTNEGKTINITKTQF